MTPSDNAYDIIKASEGLRLEAYPDPGTGGDPWTIGYGHTGPEVKPGYVIDQRRADAYLVKDAQWAADAVNDAVDVDLNQNQFDALVSFVFNVGKDAFDKSTMRRLINAKDFNRAADQFPIWNKGGGRVLPGLVARRARERQLFLKG
jgi:lysozyme